MPNFLQKSGVQPLYKAFLKLCITLKITYYYTVFGARLGSKEYLQIYINVVALVKYGT